MNIAIRVDLFARRLPGCEWRLCCWYDRVFFFVFVVDPFAGDSVHRS